MPRQGGNKENNAAKQWQAAIKWKKMQKNATFAKIKKFNKNFMKKVFLFFDFQKFKF